LEAANIVFNKAMQKVIKDAVKHARLVSTVLYYTEVLYHSLKHLLYLMKKNIF
jgi:hypothetical protein